MPIRSREKIFLPLLGRLRDSLPTMQAKNWNGSDCLWVSTPINPCTGIKQRRYFQKESGRRRSGRAGNRRGERGQSKEAPQEEIKSEVFDMIEKGGKGINISEDRMKELEKALPTYVNTDIIPFLKYIIPEKEFARFEQGKATKEEQRKVYSILEQVLPRRASQIEQMRKYKATIEENPDYSIAKCLNPSKPKTHEEFFDEIKPTLCAMHNMEESEFEEYKKSALEILAEDQVEKQNVGIIDIETKISRIVDSAVKPSDHHYKFIMPKIDAIKTNPTYPDAVKIELTEKLVSFFKQSN